MDWLRFQSRPPQSSFPRDASGTVSSESESRRDQAEAVFQEAYHIADPAAHQYGDAVPEGRVISKYPAQARWRSEDLPWASGSLWASYTSRSRMSRACPAQPRAFLLARSLRPTSISIPPTKSFCRVPPRTRPPFMTHRWILAYPWAVWPGVHETAPEAQVRYEPERVNVGVIAKTLMIKLIS